VADPGATVVVAERARFTVLTPRMIRMEWAEDGVFEDRASLVFLDRRLEVPEFTSRSDEGWRVIDTGPLQLRYREDGGPFDSWNLTIRLDVGGREVVWWPGMADTANLRGPVPVGEGLLSRDGWVVVDDSQRPLFDDSDWPWVAGRRAGARLDWTFLGYGRAYGDGLADFASVAGHIPMPPRFALGAWWSRYWAYTDREFMELARDFDRHGVPLDVLVIDMDWHETFELRWTTEARDQAGQRLGWTGYTWNRAYFPDPAAFLGWADEQGLRTPLNLHPASGIQPHEEVYPAMARAMGIDPATEAYVPFRIEDVDFARNYFDLVIHPLERQGVDFWWLDWQQWGDTSIPGLTPTWWLNYVFYSDMARQGEERPLIYHRFGGLGNHRYQIGFSGDAASTWEMLAFEPYFTATASNVLYGWWSHDIGGHLPGEVSGELYTRWVQFGALSPILRTHTTKNALAERRIWAYSPAEFDAMRGAFNLRYALVPYIYTAAREAHETGVSLVRPMYYDHPEQEDAYRFAGQYMFGEDLLVSPVTEPLDSLSLLAEREVWLPDGEWYEWYAGARLDGGEAVVRSFALDEIPIYARAGAVIPMAPPRLRVGDLPSDTIVLTLIPGADGGTRLYEDAGNDEGYLRGEYAWTAIRQERTSSRVIVAVEPTSGNWPGMPERRAYEVRLPGTWPPARVTANGVRVDRVDSGVGDAAVGSWRYDGEELGPVITLLSRSVTEGLEIVVELPDHDPSLLDGARGRLLRLARAADILENLWPADWPRDHHVLLAQTGRRIALEPGTADAELTRLRDEWNRVLADIRELEGDQAVVRQALEHLGGR